MKKAQIGAVVAKCAEEMQASDTPRVVAVEFVAALRQRAGWSQAECNVIQWEIARYVAENLPPVPMS